MFINPCEVLPGSDGVWQKANFHTHAGAPDTRLAAEEVIAAYKAAGYDILSITNQHVFSDFKQIGEENGLVILKGIEYVSDKDMLCIGINSFIDGSREAVIDECNRQGGLVILCHPNYLHEGWWKAEEMEKLHGFAGIEIYNPLIYDIQGSGLAINAWDYLLTRNRLVWGFANDDFHIWHNLGKAWNMILSEAKEPIALIDAVKKGKFYAGSGLKLEHLYCEENRLHAAAGFFNGHKPELRYTFIGEGGTILLEAVGKEAIYNINGSEKYIRVEITSRSGEMLWTQPIYQSNAF